MAHPAPDTTYTDYRLAAWTKEGSPAAAADNINPGCGDLAFDYDKINDYIHNEDIPIGNGVSAFSVGVWMNPTLTATEYAINQRATAGHTWAYEMAILLNGGIQWTVRQTNNAHNIGSVAAASSITDGVWQLVGCSIDLVAQTADCTVNGSETSYTSHNNVNGTPGTSLSAMTRVALGSFFNDSWVAGFDGILGKSFFWSGAALTAAQWLSFYNEQNDLVGKNLFCPSGLIQRDIYPRIYPKLIPRFL